MAISNRERVGKAMDLLSAGLAPFVERELKEVLGNKWQDVAEQQAKPGRRKGQVNWVDPQLLLGVLWDQWNTVFNRTLGHAERSLVSELREVRNRWAHNETINGSDAHRALDSMARLLTAVSAPQADEVEQMRMELLRTQFEEQRRGEMRKASFQATEGKPQGGLAPWREVATPHPDVASGRYQQAEFAADLWQVYQNEGTDEYKHPVEFYRRTFLTDGLTQLLKGAIERLSGKGGDPVVELQTNFGGGKTHSMLALWHLFSGTPVGELPGVDELVKKVGMPVATKVRRAVVVGTKISPGQPHKKPDGTVVRTLWGEIAWQLGGKEGYKLVKDADETATNPGDALKDLFNKYAPCLILIDEWVAYARQLHEGATLPAGTFDTQFTFAQAVSEAAKAAKQTMLVVSIPTSDNEVGGIWGQQALARLKNAIGRVESSWRPASADEGFEIVRRRLFQPLSAEKYKLRDAVARAFVEFYGDQQAEFPSECREAEYERRIKMAYPIHPELFDRLYNDWSTLDKFQRTRGVLRLMAAVIHVLWERNDANLLIMPGTVPIDHFDVQRELTRYLEDGWMPVIEKDVDGAQSLPLALDRDNPNIGRYSATRRVARTIYLGSAPTLKAANRGIDERHVKLGCVQPGETVATFGDALRRLTDKATYLYPDGTRYWYSTQQTVTRLAEDRAGQYSDHDVEDEIDRRLKEEARTRAEFSGVHACRSSSDIPDEPEARLVILGPEFPHTAKEAASSARKEAAAILESKGNGPRTCKNCLVFLAADSNRLKELQAAVRQYLAWDSIWNDKVELNLDQFQMKQAETKRKNADETVQSRIPETYQWLLVPGQSDPAGGDIEWTEIRQQGAESLAKRATKKLISQELLFTELGGVRVRMDLDRIPLWRGDHVSVKQLAEDMAKYLYLPRLRDANVLLAGIRDGLERLTWRSDTFAYADGWDEQGQRYKGLRSGLSVRVLADGQSVLVKPDVAAKQLDREEEERRPATAGTASNGSGVPSTATVESGGAVTVGPGSTGVRVVTAPPRLKRFHGTVRLDALRVGRDASRITEEVIQHLTTVAGSSVQVTLEVTADLPDGASDKLVRDVTENCRTLRFDNFAFEEE
jgi:predicted AAA+ superfamily ATPase